MPVVAESSRGSSEISHYSAHMLEIGSRARELPAPPAVVWDSLVRPRQPGTREWLNLLADEAEPLVLGAEPPRRVVWSSLAKPAQGRGAL